MFSFYETPEYFAVGIDKTRISEQAVSLLVEGESVICQCRPEKLTLDQIIFTDRRLIYAQLKDPSGKKSSISVLPYREIRAFSLETPGLIGAFGESVLKLELRNGSELLFHLKGKTDVLSIGKQISECILGSKGYQQEK